MQRKQLKDDLIILKRFTINENDILVNAFGRFSGKIQLKAKGSKKILSKFTGRLDIIEEIFLIPASPTGLNERSSATKFSFD
jgi:recombinational DNA repair protein (RecF pathway)